MKAKILITVLSLVLSLNAIAQEGSASDKPHKKVYFPAGLFNIENCTIYGICSGFGSFTRPGSEETLTKTYGIRVEPLSDALLIATLFFGPKEIDYPADEFEFEAFRKLHPNEIINGINLSMGTSGFVNSNGLTISAITQSIKNSNGISIATLGNTSFRNNGIQMAGGSANAVFSNGIIMSYMNSSVHTGNGIQISAFNDYVNFKGLQIGIINDIDSISEDFSGLQIGLYNNAKKLKGVQLGLINKSEKRTLPLLIGSFKANEPHFL